jgi:zinc D-Ala-D-Ala carboxypeptidase
LLETTAFYFIFGDYMQDIQLTPNFTRNELLVSSTATRLGISNQPDSIEIEENLMKMAKFLQQVRDKLGKPIRILSVYRSPAVNKAVGGSKTSAHMKALAADIVVPGMSVKALCEFIKNNFEYDQVIYEFGESGWCHVGIANNGKKRLQLLTAQKVGGKTVYKSGLA